MKKHLLPSILYLALGLQLSVELNPSVAQAQTPQVTQLPIVRRGGIPERRKPAGTRRGSCGETALPFTPVLPNPNPDFSGLTLQSHPTFWFYVPDRTTRLASGRFSIETEDGGATIWRSEFKLPPTPGFVSVTIPKTAKGLEEGQIYKWHFTLYCNTEQTRTLDYQQEPSFVFHKGLIKRATNIEAKAINAADPSTRSVAFYLSNKIWYDAAEHLDEIRTSPQQWNLFLEKMEMTAWKGEKVSGALYSNIPQ